MKKSIYLLPILLSVLLFFQSCENDSDELTKDIINNKQIESSDQNLQTKDPGCDLDGPFCGVPNALVSFTYTTDVGNQSIHWSVQSGNMTLVGGQGTAVATFRLANNFTGGFVNIDALGSNDCNNSREITLCPCPTNVPPPTPGPITFDIFLGSNPTNADFCTNTIANALWIDGVYCATDYIWSISPNVFGTELEQSPISPTTALLKVSQPGEYIVSVRAVGGNGMVSGTRSITLTAENCFGGGF